MFNRKPYPYKERVVNFYYRYYAKNLAVIVVVLGLYDPFLGIGFGSTPWSPNNWETLQGRDQRSRIEREWPKMARRIRSCTGQSTTR